ncbi:unnamed protein product [Ilex paraguariensis]|uniref:Uncharacterized protein n=1 Tax=Ilex paraguariensis TaxID=185542 RepID=A0ABC8SX64_9AQUA
MGSCVSVHKDPESAMKLGLSFEYKTDELVIPSPDKPLINADPPIATEFGLQSQWSPPRSVTNFGDFVPTVSFSGHDNSHVAKGSLGLHRLIEALKFVFADEPG